MANFLAAVAAKREVRAVASSRPSCHAVIRLRSGGGGGGYVLQVSFHHSAVPRRGHAIIRIKKDGELSFTIEDLSRNGTFENDDEERRFPGLFSLSADD